MNTVPSPQEQLLKAVDNYLDLSPVLQSDMTALLDCETETQHRRRNFVRASASLIEGYAHCLREMCVPSFQCIGVLAITAKERRVILSEKGCSTVDRIRLTLRSAYKLFELGPPPNFGSQEWLFAQRLFKKRDGLMHPKTIGDLAISDTFWNELRNGITWLMEQLFNFFSLLHEKLHSIRRR
jgi:hypothetical protein